MIRNSIISIKWSLISIGSILIFLSCTYDNREDLVKETVCETNNVTFSQTIQPLLTNRCGACHSGNSPESGVLLIGYSQIIKYVNDGRLLGVISHANGFPPMPFNSAKLPECDINQVKAWIENGAPNN